MAPDASGKHSFRFEKIALLVATPVSLEKLEGRRNEFEFNSVAAAASHPPPELPESSMSPISEPDGKPLPKAITQSDEGESEGHSRL